MKNYIDGKSSNTKHPKIYRGHEKSKSFSEEKNETIEKKKTFLI